VLGLSRYIVQSRHVSVSGLRELGKNWADVAGRVGSKTAAECRRFYRAERQKLALDELVADYQASKATVALSHCGAQRCIDFCHCCFIVPPARW